MMINPPKPRNNAGLGNFNQKENENDKNGFNGTGAKKAVAREIDAGHDPDLGLAYTPQHLNNHRTHGCPARCRHLAIDFAEPVVLCSAAANDLVALVPLLAGPWPA